MDTPAGLTFDDLPQLFNAADRAAVWLEAQQHAQVSRAYSVAVVDLTDARVRLEAASDEQAWATVVDATSPRP